MAVDKITLSSSKVAAVVGQIELTPESMHELHFWKSCFEESNGQPILPISSKCTVTSYSNASSWG